MDLRLQGKTAVVTGSTAGIGLSIAEELAREVVILGAPPGGYTTRGVHFACPPVPA